MSHHQAENFTLGREEGTRLAGVVMGLSVYNGIQCDVHFPPIVYKHLLRRPVGFHDLARFDPDLHGSLARVRSSLPPFLSLPNKPSLCLASKAAAEPDLATRLPFRCWNTTEM